MSDHLLRVAILTATCKHSRVIMSCHKGAIKKRKDMTVDFMTSIE